jgi:hypothetical protein
LVTALRQRSAYHIIPSRYPTIGIFDDVADAADLDAVIAIAAATNPRILEEAGDLHLVRDRDRIAGPGSTPIMAAFTHAKSTRFGNGAFGIYYASFDEGTAISETAFHRGRFLRDARLPNERLDMRVYALDVDGSYDDVRARLPPDALYDPDPAHYAAPQSYGLRVYQEDRLDGIVFRSVRRHGGEGVAAFRPKRLSRCVVAHHLEYRFREYAFEGALTISAISPPKDDR